MGLYRIFYLTYQEQFFNHLGFATVDKDVLPQKIWADCVHCPKYPDCDEFAVLKVVDNPARAAQEQGGRA